MESEETKQKLKDLKQIANFMDSSYRIPFFNISFGWDSIVGLMPGIGDIFTSLITIYILVQAFILQVPLIILVRMFINIFLDTILGFIPVIGDLFDVFFKANLINVSLLEDYAQKSKDTLKISFLYVSSFGIMLAIIMIFISAIIVSIGYGTYQLILSLK